MARIAVPPAVYNNDPATPGHGRAILMAGHRGLDGKLQLLAWGIITGVDNNDSQNLVTNISNGTGQTITAACIQVRFTLVGINYQPYSSTPAPQGFQIIGSNNPAQWINSNISSNLSNHKLRIDSSSRDICYYPLPAQVLGDMGPILGGQYGTDVYYSIDYNENDTYYSGTDHTNDNDYGGTSDGSHWPSGGTTTRPPGDVNSLDADDVIKASFFISNLPDAGSYDHLIGVSLVEFNAIPVNIGPDPGIPMIATSVGTQGNLYGPVSTTNFSDSTYTGDIKIAEYEFPLKLKTYPLPYNKSGGWALLNARIYVNAIEWNAVETKTWVIETGADLYGLDESTTFDSNGGSLLIGIGSPSATTVNSGTVISPPGNPGNP
jgi:hypothetical protein